MNYNQCPHFTILLLGLFIMFSSSCQKDDDYINPENIDENQVGTFIDLRDSNVYKTVTIGDQVWMAENLKYLPSIEAPSAGSETEAFYYVYGYDGAILSEALSTDNYEMFGVLYNWNAALKSCPTGWHLPSDAEWTELEKYLANHGYNYDSTTGGARDKIAKSLASTSGWSWSYNSGSVGNNDYPVLRNKSGFGALPGGHRFSDNLFYNIGNYGYWWCSTERNANNAWYRNIGNDYKNVHRFHLNKELGISVRCLMD